MPLVRRHPVILLRSLALLLAISVGFMAIAVFSPLHKHDASGRCSLNNFEHLAQGETQSPAPVPELAPLAWNEPPTANLLSGTSSRSIPALRGPPAFL